MASRISIVTIKARGSESDDCMFKPFSCSIVALEFAAYCAEWIDKEAWHDSLCHHDGRVSRALDHWNDLQARRGESGCSANACVTICSEFDEKTIRDFCEACSDA